MKEKINVNLTGVPETLFIPLRIRAAETLRSDAIINDPDAVEILKIVNFAPSERDKIPKGSQIGTAIRTMLFDKLADTFLKENSHEIVVNLGCGLDARYKRFVRTGSLWFDLDVEETIDVRKQFFQETDRYKMIACSMLDYRWMDIVSKDAPVLFILKGVMMYFEEKDIKALLCEIAKRFAKAEIAFDIMRKWLLKKQHPDVKKYNAPFKWAIDSPKELEQWHNTIKFKQELYFMAYGGKRTPLIMRIAMFILPSFKKAFKIVHLGLT